MIDMVVIFDTEGTDDLSIGGGNMITAAADHAITNNFGIHGFYKTLANHIRTVNIFTHLNKVTLEYNSPSFVPLLTPWQLIDRSQSNSPNSPL